MGGNPITNSDPFGLKAKPVCGKRVFVILREAVTTSCKVIPTSCNPGDSCEGVRAKIATKKLCILAQEAITKLCYPDSPSHQQRIEEQKKGLKNCEEIKEKVCKDENCE